MPRRRSFAACCTPVNNSFANAVPRLQKILEDANIKLDSVISDILGLSGRAMIEALIAGETDPGALAALAHRRIKALAAVLREALRVGDQSPPLPAQLHLDRIKALDTAITATDREVDTHIEPFRTAVLLLTTIPGVNDLGAQVIRAEIGGDPGLRRGRL
jgi:transposase